MNTRPDIYKTEFDKNNDFGGIRHLQYMHSSKNIYIYSNEAIWILWYYMLGFKLCSNKALFLTLANICSRAADWPYISKVLLEL